MRIISQTEVESLLTMREAIEIVRQAFIELSNGTAQVPPRIHLKLDKQPGTMLVMPAYLSETQSLVCKIVSVFPNNPGLNLPFIQALVFVLDATNGKPLAIIEGASLTALRTGAASGLATDLLSRKNAESLTIFGAGAQSKSQLEAVCAIRNIKQIFVYDHHPEQAKKFAVEMQGKINSRLLIAESPSQAVFESDIICAATTSMTPVFNGDELPAGTHINGVGSFTPQMQELDFVTLKKAAKIVVDSRTVALLEAGELVQAIAQNIIQASDIYGEIGEIAAGLKAGRENHEEITIFKSVGNAAQDAALAGAIYQIALEKNLGLEVDF